MGERIYPESSKPRLNGASYNPKDRIYPESAKLNGASYNPKQIPPPATHRPRRRNRRNPLCACLGCILSILVVIVLIVGIAGVIIFFTLHPKAPKYHLLNAQVSELNLTTSSDPVLNYNIAFNLQTYNPNKKIGIYYDEIQVFLFYAQVQVGQDTIPAFYQGHKNTTILVANLSGQNISLREINVSELQADIGSQSIPFQVLVKVKARVKIGRWKSPHFKVRDDCSVKISPPSAVGGARLLSNSCKADWKL